METLDPITTTFFRFAIAAALLRPYIVSPIRGSKLALNSAALPIGNAFTATTSRRVTADWQLWPVYSRPEQNHRRSHPINDSSGPDAAAAQWTLGIWRALLTRPVVGFATFFSGLLMFFYPHFHGVFVAMNDYGVGMLMVLLAAVYMDRLRYPAKISAAGI